MALEDLGGGDGERAARCLIRALPRARARLETLAQATVGARVSYDVVQTSFSFDVRENEARGDALVRAKKRIRLAGERAVDGEVIYDLLRKAFTSLSPEAAPVVIAKARRTKSWLLKCELIDALGSMGAAAALEGELDRESNPVVLATLLANLRTPKALGFLTYPQWQVRLAALQALEGTREAVGPVVAALESPDLRFQVAACEALAGMTQTDLPRDAGTWRNWWEANRADFLAGRYRPDRRRTRPGPGRTTFYGVPVVSSNVCFVIDRSRSMRKHGRFEAATDELRRLLDRLPDGSRFNILFFGETVTRFARTTRVLDREGRRAAARFIERQKSDHGTDLYRALEEALALVGNPRTGRLRPDSPDTFIILSDGEATVGRLVNDELVARVIARRSRYLRPMIHTVSLSSAAASMRRLADLTGGRHRDGR